MDQDNTTARVDSEDRPLDASIRIIEKFRNLQEELKATQVERDQFREERDYWMDLFQRAVNRDIELSALEQIGKEDRK